jgi:hypothetical protein
VSPAAAEVAMAPRASWLTVTVVVPFNAPEPTVALSTVASLDAAERATALVGSRRAATADRNAVSLELNP